MGIVKKTRQEITVTSANNAAAIRDELTAVPHGARLVGIESTEITGYSSGNPIRERIALAFELEVES